MYSLAGMILGAVIATKIIYSLIKLTLTRIKKRRKSSIFTFIISNFLFIIVVSSLFDSASVVLMYLGLNLIWFIIDYKESKDIDEFQNPSSKIDT